MIYVYAYTHIHTYTILHFTCNPTHTTHSTHQALVNPTPAGALSGPIAVCDASLISDMEQYRGKRHNKRKGLHAKHTPAFLDSDNSCEDGVKQYSWRKWGYSSLSAGGD